MGPTAALQRQARIDVFVNIVVEGQLAAAGNIGAAGAVQAHFFAVVNVVVGHGDIVRFLFDIYRTFKGQVAIG